MSYGRLRNSDFIKTNLFSDGLFSWAKEHLN